MNFDLNRELVEREIVANPVMSLMAQEGIAALRMLARHPQTAQRISQRLAEFFIADQPSESVVQALANRFLESGGDLKIVMRTLLSHPDFWANQNALFNSQGL